MNRSETNPTRHLESPAEAARKNWQAAGSQSSMASYVTVALASLGLGVGLTLVAVPYAAWLSGGSTMQDHSAHTVSAVQPEAHAGHGAEESGMVYISPARQQLIGVRTAPVSHRPLNRTIRTVGTLAYDETRIVQIHTKVAGWVEQLHVDFVGKTVERGQPLFAVYSPELVATQNEYLLALRARDQLASSNIAETRSGAASLVDAARDRLSLWDVSDRQIDRLEQTGQAQKSVTLYSPFRGIVLERNVYAGQYITPELATLKIADLSTIWAIGSIFEYEVGLVRVGQEAEIEFPYGGSVRSLKGKVTFIYPDIDPMTRRARVRVEFRNPGMELKPESYVTMVIRSDEGHQLAIPREAVIDTGLKRYAILAHPDGYFEPRELQVGPPLDDVYPVVEGVEEGMLVVTSAQFLIDSETNLYAAMQSMIGHGHAHGEMDMGPSRPPPPRRPQPEDHSGHGGAPPAEDHSGHQQAAPGQAPDHSGHEQPAKPPAKPPKGGAEDHSGHR
jgi:membrane fusion protein, copper/silver efflux system